MQRPSLKCPYCSHTLARKKDRKHFILHKCINPKCSYYLHNLKKVDKTDLNEDYGKNKYKLHYIYREFTINFFKMDITTLPKNASSLKFSKNNAYIMSLCLSYRINLGLSLRKTAQAMKDIHGVSISHQMVANYCKTASICIKPFVDTYPYEKGSVMVGDETYIKVRGVKGYIWLIINAATRTDAVSTEFRPYKQMIERLNRIYKASYRSINGFDNYDGANYDLALWVAYYNFLRPHKFLRFHTPVEHDIIKNGDNMPAKWQLMIFLGQQTIKRYRKLLRNQERNRCQGNRGIPQRRKPQGYAAKVP